MSASLGSRAALLTLAFFWPARAIAAAPKAVPAAPRADSTAAATPADTSAVRLDAALADSMRALDARVAHLDSLPSRLSVPDRRVLAELVAAAHELDDSGDVDAARLAIEDALEFLRQRSR